MESRRWRQSGLRRGAFLLTAILALAATAAESPEEITGATAGAEGEGRASGEADASGKPAGEFTFPPEVEALLNQASDPDEYAKTERCINSRDIRNTEVLDNRHLVFELSANRWYLVQFPYACAGMRRGVSLIYETRTGRLCRLDQIRAFEPGPAIPNPPCTLPSFMQVEQEQVALLRESLKAQRKAEVDAYKAEKKAKKAQKAQKAEEAASEPVSG